MKFQNTIPFHLLSIVFLLTAISSPAQATGRKFNLICSINQISSQNRSLNVNCTASIFATDHLTLKFVDRFAGVDRLSERVFALKVKDESGAVLPLKIHGDGLYSFNRTDRPQQVAISYEMRLARALDPSQYALTSSIGQEAAFLMPADLLPKLCVGENGDCEAEPLTIRVVAPSGWKIATTEKSTGDYFEVADPQRAVFSLGNFREQTTSAGAMKIRTAAAGAWSFSDEGVFRLAEAIAREQAAIIDGAEAGDFLVALAPFPLPLTGLRSSAATIGRTVILQLNPNNNSEQTFAHFRKHLAHEMFHFYLPNAFRVRENFDWFWEGFTRYIALLTLARLRLIGLPEYLDAIGEEYEAYAFNPRRMQISLIAASPEKFANYPSYDLVYRKGMLAAALYDLELRRQSRSKYTAADVMRGLYHNYARRGLEVGNKEVLSELSRLGEFKQSISDDIEGTKEIDLVERIKPFGLVVDWGPATRGKVRLSKAAKLSARQSELLDQLAAAGN